MALNVKVDTTQAIQGLIYDVKPNNLLRDENPNLVIVSLLHNVEGIKIHCVPCLIINLSHDKIFLPKGEIMRHLEPITISMEEITTETLLKGTEIQKEVDKEEVSRTEKNFITSPADVERHKRVVLQDADILNKYRKQF